MTLVCLIGDICKLSIHFKSIISHDIRAFCKKSKSRGKIFKARLNEWAITNSRGHWLDPFITVWHINVNPTWLSL